MRRNLSETRDPLQTVPTAHRHELAGQLGRDEAVLAWFEAGPGRTPLLRNGPGGVDVGSAAVPRTRRRCADLAKLGPANRLRAGGKRTWRGWHFGTDQQPGPAGLLPLYRGPKYRGPSAGPGVCRTGSADGLAKWQYRRRLSARTAVPSSTATMANARSASRRPPRPPPPRYCGLLPLRSRGPA